MTRANPRVGGLVRVPDRDIGSLSHILSVTNGGLGVIVGIQDVRIFPNQRDAKLCLVLSKNKIFKIIDSDLVYLS
tara:strand:- start:1159 stop:1383 length:225 start_codon:yes stop_codon:yes gene_type:complete